MDNFIKVIKALLNALMTVIIIIGCSFVLLFLIGIEPFVVESGSMEPNIKTYSLVMINKHSNYDDIKENDVIGFKTETGAKVIHRAIKITNEGIETKGDANEVSDGVSVTRSNFIGKNLCSIPKAGYVVKLIQTKRGKIILITVVIVLLLAGILLGEPDKEKKNKKK